MDVENSFNIQIMKIKRRIVFRKLHGALLIASLIFLCICSAFFLLPLAGFTSYPFTGEWYLAAVGLSLLTAIFIALYKRSNWLNIFIEIDHRLGLQDRLSTAYEYLISSRRSEFTDLLMHDAAAILKQFSRQRLLPLQLTKLHLAVIILLILNMVFYSGIFHPPGFQSARRDLAKIDKASKILQNYTIARIDDRAFRQTPPQSESAKKLKQLSSKLSDGSRPVPERTAALARFLKEVQGEQTRLATELATRLDSIEMKDFPVQKMPDPAKLSSNQLEKLKALLNKSLNNRVPDSFSQNIETLQELDNMQKLLARILDELQDAKPVADDPEIAVARERRKSTPKAKPENSSDDPNLANSIRQFSEDRKGGTGNQSEYRGSSNLRHKDEELADGTEQPGGSSASAGRAKSNTESRSSYPIEKSPGAATQDRPASSRAKSYLVHIRALTEIGEAGLKEDQIFQTYRQEVESILLKEEMPENYRQYIKNYFISVGMHGED